MSHDREEESPEAKQRWYLSLSIEERMQLFDEFTEMLLTLDPDLMRKKDAQPVPGRVCVLTLDREFV